ncbi:MAG TPA: hypothetical protein VFW25_12545 [Silvibacterium sp.]|nr:hypothetical protein [Silvibacterium sp.]
MIDEESAGEVAAMQFAGGMSIARLAEEWERDAAWVEEAIRRALLAAIPQRDGGLKTPRELARTERSEELQTVSGAQGKLNLWA